MNTRASKIQEEDPLLTQNIKMTESAMTPFLMEIDAIEALVSENHFNVMTQLFYGAPTND